MGFIRESVPLESSQPPGLLRGRGNKEAFGKTCCFPTRQTQRDTDWCPPSSLSSSFASGRCVYISEQQGCPLPSSLEASRDFYFIRSAFIPCPPQPPLMGKQISGCRPMSSLTSLPVSLETSWTIPNHTEIYFKNFYNNFQTSLSWWGWEVENIHSTSPSFSLYESFSLFLFLRKYCVLTKCIYIFYVQLNT